MMVRSLETVQRYRKSVPIQPPFGGYSSRNDPLDLGPVRALDARNVVLDDGRMANRFGFVPLGGASAAVSTLPVHGRIEALGGWFDTDYTVTPNVLRNYVCAKVALYPDYTAAKLFVRRIDQTVWTEVGTSLSFLAGRGRFVPFGVSSRHVDAVRAGFDTSMLLLDGGDYNDGELYKVVGNPPRVIRVGLRQLSLTSATSVQVTTHPGANALSSGTHRYRITRANTLLRAADDPSSSPGLESNVLQTEEITVGATSVIEVRFSNHPSLIDEFDEWNVVRVYELDAGGYYRFIRDYERREFGSPVSYCVPDPAGGGYMIVLHGTPTMASGSGAWDYAPTRNHPPTKFRHYTMYQGRSFWATGKDNHVYYSDPEGVLTGGNREALSHESLGGFDGPVTLLATAFDQVIIGTPSALYVLTGTITSHTNQSVSQDQDMAMPSAQIDRVEASRSFGGPVRDGLGASVQTPGGALYFISRNGLEAYDGRMTRNVSDGIRDAAKNLEVIPADRLLFSEGMPAADLVHDGQAGRIMLLANFLHDYGDVPLDLRPQFPEPQNVKSVVLCYHYRYGDSETGLGQWTIWDRIGPGELLAGTTDSSKQTRCSAMTMSVRHNEPLRLLLASVVGMVEDYSELLVTYKTPVVLEEDEYYCRDMIYGDSNGFTRRQASWRWQSGRHDWGLPDRRKHFWFLTVTVTARIPEADADQRFIVVGFQVDDKQERTVVRRVRLTTGGERFQIKVPIMMAGYAVSVWFQPDSVNAKYRFEVLSYALDAEPLDDF